MSGRGGRARGPGWRSLEALRWLERLEVAGVEPLGHALGFGWRATYSHIARLAEAGLVVRASDRGGSVVAITAAGRREIGADRGDVRAGATHGSGLRHARAVSWVAALLTLREREWISERELRGIEDWQVPVVWAASRGRHRPDLGVVMRGARVAVESRRGSGCCSRNSGGWRASRPPTTLTATPASPASCAAWPSGRSHPAGRGHRLRRERPLGARRRSGGRAMTPAGAQRELARYQLPDGPRALVAQRIAGRVALSDVPVADTAGRVYLIERHVTSQAELTALVAVYVEHSEQAGCPAAIAHRRRDRRARRRAPNHPVPARRTSAMPTRPRLTETEREQRRAADRRFVQQAVEQLRTSDGWQRWLTTRRHFHSYSLRNQLLIALQRPDATRVAGFKAWLALGYCVRRGEKALRIYAPCPPSQAKLRAWRDAGANPATKPRTGFRLAAVFDRAQVDELPPPAQPAPLDPPAAAEIDGDQLASWLAPLEAFAGEIGSQVVYAPIASGADGFYLPTTKAIVIDERHSPNRRVKTLVHELAHALVRADRHPEDPELDYAAEELVAETTAYSVCNGSGIDPGGDSIAYLASWSEHTPTATIEATAALIDRLSRRIEDALTDTDLADQLDAVAAS